MKLLLGIYVMIEKELQKMIGIIELEIRDEFFVEFGYILNKNYNGKGYMIEVCLKLMLIGFEYLDLERIYVRFDINNKKFGNVMEWIGMKKEGEFCYFVKNLKGEWKIRVYYFILKEEYFNKVNIKQFEMQRIRYNFFNQLVGDVVENFMEGKNLKIDIFNGKIVRIEKINLDYFEDLF